MGNPAVDFAAILAANAFGAPVPKTVKAQEFKLERVEKDALIPILYEQDNPHNVNVAAYNECVSDSERTYEWSRVTTSLFIIRGEDEKIAGIVVISKNRGQPDKYDFSVRSALGSDVGMSIDDVKLRIGNEEITVVPKDEKGNTECINKYSHIHTGPTKGNPAMVDVLTLPEYEEMAERYRLHHRGGNTTIELSEKMQKDMALTILCGKCPKEKNTLLRLRLPDSMLMDAKDIEMHEGRKWREGWKEGVFAFDNDKGGEVRIVTEHDVEERAPMPTRLQRRTGKMGEGYIDLVDEKGQVVSSPKAVINAVEADLKAAPPKERSK